MTVFTLLEHSYWRYCVCTVDNIFSHDTVHLKKLQVYITLLKLYLRVRNSKDYKYSLQVWSNEENNIQKIIILGPTRSPTYPSGNTIYIAQHFRNDQIWLKL